MSFMKNAAGALTASPLGAFGLASRLIDKKKDKTKEAPQPSLITEGYSSGSMPNERRSLLTSSY